MLGLPEKGRRRQVRVWRDGGRGAGGTWPALQVCYTHQLTRVGAVRTQGSGEPTRRAFAGVLQCGQLSSIWTPSPFNEQLIVVVIHDQAAFVFWLRWGNPSALEGGVGKMP